MKGGGGGAETQNWEYPKVLDPKGSGVKPVNSGPLYDFFLILNLFCGV